MKHLMRRLSRVADSSSTYALLRSDTLSSPRHHSLRRYRRRSALPAGHVPVYVGDEMERFVISADLMNHPVFVKLLNRSAQEYGYGQKGALRIPCNVVVFEKVLDDLRSGRDVNRDVIDLIGADELFFL